METEGQEPAVTNEGQVPTNPTTEAETTGYDTLTSAELIAELLREKAKTKEANKEAAAHRVKNKAFEKDAEDRRQASLSELEKAQQAAQSASEARSALEQKLAKRDAISALKSSGIIDPDLAFLAIKDQIEIKDGDPTNIDDLVAEFIKSRPQMVATTPVTPPDTKSTNPPAPAAPAQQPGHIPGRFYSRH